MWLRAMFIGHGRALEILPKEFRSKGSGADVRERDISDSTHWQGWLPIGMTRLVRISRSTCESPGVME